VCVTSHRQSDGYTTYTEHSKTTTISQPLIPDSAGEPAPELSYTFTQYTTFLIFKFLTSTPNLASHYTSKAKYWVLEGHS